MVCQSLGGGYSAFFVFFSLGDFFVVGDDVKAELLLVDLVGEGVTTTGLGVAADVFWRFFLGVSGAGSTKLLSSLQLFDCDTLESSNVVGLILVTLVGLPMLLVGVLSPSTILP
jgi:hypothetical protein